jgi:hypothetical protein
MSIAPTHEPELTDPVDLCGPGGRLNHAARGWSRVPLHRANLTGHLGRNKRWDYWAVLTPTHAISVTYADVDYLGIVDLWWAELATGRTGGRNRSVPGARGIRLPDRPGAEPLTYRSRLITVTIADTDESTTIDATWTERSGATGRLEATIGLPEGHESLNVVIPWSDRTFQYTSKHQARPARGVLRVGSEEVRFDDGGAWGVLDVGRGRWPYRTNWNWGGGAGIAEDGATVGIQLGGKWTEGTGFTENGVIVDGRLHKIGRELTWDYSWDEPLRPWRVTDPGGALDLRLDPRYDKHTRITAVVLGMEVHQVFGTWSGWVAGEAGDHHEIRDVLGFAEESRSRW